jgi:hypothetical protein
MPVTFPVQLAILVWWRHIEGQAAPISIQNNSGLPQGLSLRSEAG